MTKLLLPLLLVAMSYTAAAQKKDSVNATYSRSSLALFLMEEDQMPQKAVIVEAFKSSAFPNKFNNHNLTVRTFGADTIKLEEVDYKNLTSLGTGAAPATAAPTKKPGGSFMGGLVKSVASDATGGVTGTGSKEEFAAKANKYFTEHNVSKQVLDKWFVATDSTGKPCLSTDLIFERGLYGANQSDIEKAKSSVLGTNLLKDAGFELIDNSFVIACRYRFMSKDELVAMIESAMTAITEATGNAYAQLGAKAAVMAIKASLGAGHYVVTNSYLFQLQWNEDIANQVYATWDDMEKYNALEVPKLKYIGNETAWANVKAGIFTDKSEAELIEIATVNSTDVVLAKLEKKYDVFKTKTPIIVNEDGTITAHIGLKESLEPKDKFEVLEAVQDENGKVTYARKGIITVSKDKTKIWNNCYMADQEPDHDANIKATSFDGFKKGYMTGMLIRMIK